MEASGQLHDPTAQPQEKSPWYPLDRKKRKIPNPYRDQNPRPSSPQPSATPLSYPGSLANIEIDQIYKNGSSLCMTLNVDLVET
jgi:hypothetical protein